MVRIKDEIQAYNASQKNPARKICEILCKAIMQSLPEADNKIWHGSPVWFLDGNPVAGYDVLKDCVRLLFWSGQSFGDVGLKPNGSFKAAEMRYTNESQINKTDLSRWLDKSKIIQWDYKNIVKRRGELVRLS